MESYGSIKINLDKLIKEREISKNKICQRAEVQHRQLNRYCNNEITRFDADVLARLCTVLNCSIGELLEFVPPGDNDSEN